MASPSAVSAADDAIQNTVASLFRPFRLERWLVLGFAAFLDQCSRLASSSCQVRPPADERMGQVVRDAIAWLGDRPLVAAGIGAVVFAVLITVTVLVLWISCRGRFLYLDNVATGRADIRRPWGEHANRAGSHFAWVLGTVLGTVVLCVSLAVPMAWAMMALFRHGPRVAPLATLAVAALALLVVAIASSLLMVILRDFVAPLQWYADLSCGEALARFRGLFRADPGLFVVYVLLKLVFSIVVGLVAIAACCVTCCCAALPFFQQVLLQPLFYFERRWSLEVLRQLGFAPPGIVPVPPLEPITPPPPPDPAPPIAPDSEPGLSSF